MLLTPFLNVCDACGFVPELSINSFNLRHVDAFFKSALEFVYCAAHISVIVQDAGGLHVIYPYPQSTLQTILLLAC
jgi:hypothetical protein